MPDNLTMAKESVPSTRMWLYTFLSKRGWPKSYTGKIFFIAFLGTHVPLLALFGWAINAASLPPDQKRTILLVALVATLAGTLGTLVALRLLLEPIVLAFGALRSYLERSARPTLPTNFTDEVGVLMADTTFVIGRLDDLIQRLANYDEVTSLPNRNLLAETLAAWEPERPLALIVIQVEGLGELAGSLELGQRDQILYALGQRFSAQQRPGDVVARSGDDSFAFLLEDFNSLELVEARTRDLLAATSEPMRLTDRTVNLRAVAGIALPAAGGDLTRLLGQAESAAQEARRTGPGSFSHFCEEATEAVRYRLAMESNLAKAMPHDEFRLVYQPIVEVSSGQLVCTEALIRWTVDGNPISPAVFIPIAEESGQIVAIGKWVLRAACRQAHEWKLAGLPVRVSVNVSPRQLRTQGFAADVAEALRETLLDPKLLQLEVTEGALVEDAAGAVRVLSELRALGVSIALDDFGTGYSSLSYLKKLPIDVLKIDQSFVRGLPQDGEDLAIVRSVIALADSLGLTVVAEGVETEPQVECLVEEGCSRIQGYLFGKPMPSEELVQRFRTAKAAPASAA
jgi:diguanylate cyclase (GGDEF)-like protein